MSFKPFLGSAPTALQLASATSITHLVLFDIDGTLLSASGPQANKVQHDAFRVALREVWGVEGGLEDVEHAGKTDQWILRDLHAHTACTLPVEAAIAAAAERMESYCAAAPEPGAGLAALPGVAALLAALRAHPQVVCGLVTGNLQSIAWRKLRACGLELSGFVTGGFGSDAEDRAELVRVAVARALAVLPGMPTVAQGLRVTHIGDTPRDVEAAFRAGAQGLGVATGKFTVQQLQQACAELTAAGAAGGAAADTASSLTVLESLADLKTVLELLALPVKEYQPSSHLTPAHPQPAWRGQGV